MASATGASGRSSGHEVPPLRPGKPLPSAAAHSYSVVSLLSAPTGFVGLCKGTSLFSQHSDCSMQPACSMALLMPCRPVSGSTQRFLHLTRSGWWTQSQPAVQKGLCHLMWVNAWLPKPA